LIEQDWCRLHGEGLRIAVQVTPNASKSEAVDVIEGVLKIRLKAQPIEGKANEALIRFISDQLDVPKSRVSLARGLSSRQKIIEVNTTMSVAQAKAALLPLL
jgi:uncharacterized protein (TIGR00251 family)